MLEGASVTVFRNDEISLQDLIEKKPTQLVISPGPGHPDSDSGISRDVIKHFAGKIPVLGVCMGQYVESTFSGIAFTEADSKIDNVCFQFLADVWM